MGGMIEAIALALIGLVLLVFGIRKFPRRHSTKHRKRPTTKTQPRIEPKHPDYTEISDEEPERDRVDDPDFFERFERESTALDE